MMAYSILLLAVSLLLIGVLSDWVIRYILVLSKVLGMSEMTQVYRIIRLRQVFSFRVATINQNTPRIEKPHQSISPQKLCR